MKTPDKIFLPGDTDWPSAAILTLGNQPGDVEYIRKDAVLELLQNRNEEIREAAHCAFRSFELQEIYRRINEL